MRDARVWKKLLGADGAVIEDVSIEQDALIVKVRPKAGEKRRCPHCARRCPRYDNGEGRRRWRALDFATTLVYLEADAPRVFCRAHGVVVAAVPWARHGARFTAAFEDQIAWLCVHTSKSATAELMRVSWRAVGGVVERVCAETEGREDLLVGLRRIGIDEISNKRGQNYIMVVVDHDSGRLVWAHPGRDKATVHRFLDALGPERCEQIELVSCDMAGWISGPVAERLANAVRCVDPFHVVKLAGDALDEIRREVWNEARLKGQRQIAAELKGARFALWKNPENLTERQQTKLARIEELNRPLFRAYLLSQQLREVYRAPFEHALGLLDAWLSWARRSRLKPFVRVAATITEQRQGIEAALAWGLSNARVEQMNTQIRLIARRAFGFHSPEALIALAKLTLSGLCPPLPAEGA